MKTIPQPVISSPKNQVSTEIDEQIRSRAYQLYEQRGSSSGCELQDWLQAESEILEINRQPLAA